jgi:hypothetical protein
MEKPSRRAVIAAGFDFETATPYVARHPAIADYTGQRRTRRPSRGAADKTGICFRQSDW